VIVGVGVRVGEGVMGVLVMLGVTEGVSEGVREGVRDDVSVIDAVSVAGWNNVGVRVLVGVSVAVWVKVGVLVTVPVKIDGVELSVGVGVMVKLGVTEGVKSEGLGARAMAIQPMQ
jgi:hypothetical protein